MDEYISKNAVKVDIRKEFTYCFPEGISMKPLDRNYLNLQFKTNVLSKSGTEYQTFFEGIMEEVYDGFQKIRPYGNQGDGGNDGYRPEAGIYYQVYSPNDPELKEADGANKFENDANKLIREWNEISKIKEYYFVFNDKYRGSVKALESVKAKLNKKHEDIDFKLFLAKDLEKIFKTLKEEQLLDLGFVVDRRQSIDNANTFMNSVSESIGQGYVKFADGVLKDIKDTIDGLKDENLVLEFSLLEAKCLREHENVEEAKKKYEEISRKYPSDPRATLYLAELYLNNNELEINKELLEEAEKRDGDHWLLKMEKLIRKQYIRDDIGDLNITKEDFPESRQAQITMYRYYAVTYNEIDNFERADEFIAEAIKLDPCNVRVRTARLSMLNSRLYIEEDELARIKKAQELLKALLASFSKSFNSKLRIYVTVDCTGEVGKIIEISSKP